MKIKLLISIFFFILNPQILNANSIFDKNIKAIEMEIFKDDKLIGYNNYFFTKNKNIIKVKNEINFKVALFGVNIFNIDGHGVEEYFNDKLISFKSKTTQNKKNKFVNLHYDKKINKYLIKGSSYSGEASIENIVGSWWNNQLLKADSQISPISGSIKSQVVTFIGREKVNLYGKIFEANHFKLKSKDPNTPDNKKLDFDIWLDIKDSLIIKVLYSRMGKWEYRLKKVY